ncbi:MAG: hypothetical protein JWO81_1393 [Alphaproteobacteria bacterium]|nr:hypothetical protein [Alphaproteobacteria bacterium]
MKNTAATGVPSIAVAGDFPTLNQNTTGSAAKLTTARTFSITGKATAAGGTFDGSGGLAINVTAVTLVAGDIPNIAESQVTNLTADLAAKANLAGGQAFTDGMTTDTFYASTNFRIAYSNAYTYRSAGGAAAAVQNQIVGPSTLPASQAVSLLVRHKAGTGSGYKWSFARSENGTTGSHTAISTTTDDLGRLSWTGSDGTDFRDTAAILGFVNNTIVNANGFEGRLEFFLGAPATGILTRYAALDPTGLTVTGVSNSTGNQLISGTGAQGYATGSGGAVTQATNKATGVTLNKTNGQITMNAAALAANTSVAFTLTNSLIAATDVVNVSIASGATSLAYLIVVQATAAGSCSIAIRNVSAGSLSEAVVINFAVLKAVNA